MIGRVKRAQFLKYRQGGVTTLFCIYYLDDAIWTPGFGAAIIAHEREALDKIFQIVELAFDNMPESVKPKTRQDTLRMLRFESSFDGQALNSSIYVALKLRSGTVQALHITERAYIEGSASTELEAGSKQAVGLHGRITEETTANGFNDFEDVFTENYNNAEPGPLDTIAYFFAWHEQNEYQIPGPPIVEYTERQLKLKEKVANAYAGKQLTDPQLYWYEWKEKELIKAARKSDDKVRLSGEQLMMQEYPSTVLEAFQSGLGSVFDQELLGTYSPQKPKRVYISKGKAKGEKVYIWHEPVKEGDEYEAKDEDGEIFTMKHKVNGFYGLGCDPSDGTGGDDAVIDVWDDGKDQYRQCAQWAGQLRPDLLAELVAEMAEMYNEALAGVENNMISTILFLSKIYENYFITVTVDEKRDRRTKKIGWTTSGKSRDMMIDVYNQEFEEESLEINSGLTLKEMRTFVKKEGGKREHADGKTDDALFAAFIAIQMIKHKDRSRTRKRVFSGKPTGL